ncbi:MAG: response regulator transcription factor [Acidobacteria bacterium]|nr:response regulator transcription factor [Acidobacteriota bacterium]
MRILIVDDNSNMREMTRFFLDDLGAVFRECEDGVEALEAYRSFRPDWVLMDWEMARMDGITATRRIVRAFPQARIVLFTQYDDAQLKAAAGEAGALGYVLKDELINLRRILTASR